MSINRKKIWRLSPSGLYNYEECKACFWLEHHHKRQPSIPFVLNSAMDVVFKHRYDEYRRKEQMPPEVESLARQGFSLFPDLKKLSLWRSKSEALRLDNPNDGYELVGKIDDLLIHKDGYVAPIDFKSSGYAPKPDKKKYYISQLNAYGLMFRNRNYEVSDRAYLVHYFLRDTSNPSLNVEFNSHIDEVDLDIDSFQKKLSEIATLLNGPYPGDDLGCVKCRYYIGRDVKKN